MTNGAPPEESIIGAQSPATAAVSSWLDRGLLVAALGLVAWASWGYAARALSLTEDFNVFPADGAFQIYNPLRRMAAGQLPGREFQYFHGVGVPWLFAPLFRLLGGDLRASELSRYFVSNGTFLVTSAVFFRAVGLRWRTALPCAVLAIALAPYLSMAELVYPGNSLFATRTAGPVLAAALLLFRTGGRQVPATSGAALRLGGAAGAVLGLSFVFGTEQALAAVAALSVVALLLPPFEAGVRLRILLAGTAIAAFVGAAALTATVLTLGHPFASLKYALAEAPADQFWYFGVPPNGFVYDFRVFLEPQILPRIAPGMIVLPLVVFLRRRAMIDRGTAFALSFFLGYGLVSLLSMLGIVDSKYPGPSLRAAAFAAVVLIGRFLPTLVSAIPAAVRPLASALPAAAAAVVCALVGFDFPVDHIATGGALGGPTLGVRLDAWWADAKRVDDQVLGSAPLAPGSVWATYVSLAEAERGYLQPAEDYLIHALGPERRRRYSETFERIRPTFVRLMRRSFFNYEEWLQNEWWRWYESIALNYEPLAQSGFCVWWRRSGEWREPAPWGWAEAVAGRERVALPATDSGCRSVRTVEIEYEVENPWRRVPLLGALPRYFVAVLSSGRRSFVSLPPGERSFRFPVFAHPGESPALQFVTASPLPGPKLVPRLVRTREVPGPCQRVWALLDEPG